MTVEKKYASTVQFCVLWNNCNEALGVEDNSCADSSDVGPLNKLDVLFGFALPSNAIITNVLVDCKVACSFGNYLSIVLGDGHGGSETLGEIDGAGRPLCFNTAYLGAKDVTAFLDTPAKVNNCEIRFHHVQGGGGLPWTAYVDASYIQVTYTVPPSRPFHHLFFGLTPPFIIDYRPYEYAAWRKTRRR